MATEFALEFPDEPGDHKDSSVFTEEVVTALASGESVTRAQQDGQWPLVSTGLQASVGRYASIFQVPSWLQANDEASLWFSGGPRALSESRSLLGRSGSSQWPAGSLLAQLAPVGASKEQIPAGQTFEILTPAAQEKAPQAADLDEERARLKELVEAEISSGRNRRRLLEDMEDLEERATADGLTEEQVAETYFHASRLLEGTSTILSDDRREKVAAQIIRNAANPNRIDQGRHGTCNVAVVEVRVYTRDPQAAARLVADVVTTGSFVTQDGSTITPTTRSLEADDEARSHPPANGRRGHASQIFQLTAGNIRWQRTWVTPDGKVAGRGNIIYEQIPNKRSRLTGDTGERVMDYSVNPARETTKYQQGPSLSVSRLEDIANQITGEADRNFVIENNVSSGPFTVTVGSPNELEDAILKLKQDGQFPAFIRVHTGNDPFDSDRGGSYSRQRGVWHVVSITGYDETSKKVTIDNQWGTRSDKTVDLEKLYRSTMEPGTPEWKKKHEFYKGSIWQNGFDSLDFLQRLEMQGPQGF